jgi:hypothetical protein
MVRARASIVYLVAVVGALAVGTVLVIANLGDPGPDLLIYGSFSDGPLGEVILSIYVVLVATLSAIAALLYTKVPGNSIGPVLAALGAWQAAAFMIGAVLVFLSPWPQVGTWLGAWSFTPVVAIPALVLLILFPDGHPPSPRWRPLVWFGLVGAAGWSVFEAFRPVLGIEVVANPFANPEIASLGNVVSLASVVGFVGSVTSIVMKFRRARGDERLQMKWITLAGVLLVVGLGAAWIVSEASPEDFGPVGIAMYSALSLSLFVAIGMAILKYRLYDIDRLISRSVSYVLVAGLLAAVYATVAILVPQVIGLSGRSSLATAAGTLAVAGLFRPISSRLHRAVDRRFNRTRFNAEIEIRELATELGRRVDLVQVSAAVSSVVHRNLAPSSLGIWIRTS